MKLPPELEAKILALAGETPTARTPVRKRRLVALDRGAAWSFTLTPACRVVTEANTHEHWSARKRRFDIQRAAVRRAWDASPVSHPLSVSRALVVTLTHTGPKMDTDNLASAFKGVRDEVAELIGVDDGDGRVTWVYEQTRGKPGVTIRIEGV